MKVPADLGEAWAALAEDADALGALGAARRIRDGLARWEAHLARVALARGATWETIGEALGTSRQAAWERLRPGIAAEIEVERAELRVEQQRLRAERRKR